MIGLDTNVVVRYLVQDDAEQGARAAAAIGRLTSDERGYITKIVLVETFWVLTRAYKLPRDTVMQTLAQLVERDEILVEDQSRTTAAIQRACNGGDLADALIVETCRAAGAPETITFDRDAAKRGMTLI